ncbi:hypothetical protein CSB37_02820 [bacterium DOLZORAL124_38_8]|nr:MAG: hypothetical protein CSB37_02820 [bacterium DOLZORAL124_38_8]
MSGMKKILITVLAILCSSSYVLAADEAIDCTSANDCEEQLQAIKSDIKKNPIVYTSYGIDPRIVKLKILELKKEKFEHEPILQKTVKAYNTMIHKKNKNFKLYQKTAQYLKTNYLKDSKITSHAILENIDFELDIYPRLKNQYTDQNDQVDYENLNKALESFTRVFNKAGRNNVNELREAIPNGGGVLPGSKSQNGVAYAKEKFLPKLTNTLVVLALSISTLMLIIGGIMYVTSFGEDDSKTKAKNIILYAIIGVIVSSLSYTVVKFVIGINFNIL